MTVNTTEWAQLPSGLILPCRTAEAHVRRWRHDLACWCPLDQPCHADVLLELANAAAKEAEDDQA